MSSPSKRVIRACIFLEPLNRRALAFLVEVAEAYFLYRTFGTQRSMALIARSSLVLSLVEPN